jgi:hypothetical protein
MVHNATFNNISVISWQSVLLVEVEWFMFLTGAWVVKWFMFLTGAWVVEWFMFLTGAWVVKWFMFLTDTILKTTLIRSI